MTYDQFAQPKTAYRPASAMKNFQSEILHNIPTQSSLETNIRDESITRKALLNIGYGAGLYVWYATDEMVELRRVKIEFIGKFDRQVIEFRAVKAVHELLQILDVT